MRKGRIAVSLLIFVVLSMVALTSPASARWRIHNGNDVSDMTAPPGGTAQQTCSDQLRGASGWATFVEDPTAPDPLPPEAFMGTTYDVWKAPPGFSNFSEGQEVQDNFGNTIGFTFFDPVTNETSSATLVIHFTTVDRMQMVTPAPIGTSGVYVFAAAPITQALPGVAPGDVVGLKPIGGSTTISLTAINCTDHGDFTISDFFGAVDAGPTVNLGAAGTSYNVRFRLTDQAGQTVSRKTSVAAVTFAKLGCATFSGQTDSIESSTTGLSKLRFAKASDLFVYRWQTPSSVGCYRLKFIYDSGQHSILNFKLK
ncbi:MAG: PxKF domain-containing protein [Candidatus Nanopelagicales bacterium]